MSTKNSKLRYEDRYNEYEYGKYENTSNNKRDILASPQINQNLSQV